MEKALKMPSVGPVMVTILSGDDPSDMLIRAPLWKDESRKFQPQFVVINLPQHKVYMFSHHGNQIKYSPPPSFSLLFLLSEII